MFLAMFRWIWRSFFCSYGIMTTYAHRFWGRYRSTFSYFGAIAPQLTSFFFLQFFLFMDRKRGIATTKPGFFFRESISSHTNQRTDERQIPDFTWSGAIMTQKWRQYAEMAFFDKKPVKNTCKWKTEADLGLLRMLDDMLMSAKCRT